MNIDSPELSLVIPCYNEEGNLRELIKAIRDALEPLKLPYEIVITDDCSADKSWEMLTELAAGDPRIRAQRFAFEWVVGDQHVDHVGADLPRIIDASAEQVGAAEHVDIHGALAMVEPFHRHHGVPAQHAGKQRRGTEPGKQRGSDAAPDGHGIPRSDPIRGPPFPSERRGLPVRWPCPARQLRRVTNLCH